MVVPDLSIMYYSLLHHHDTIHPHAVLSLLELIRALGHSADLLQKSEITKTCRTASKTAIEVDPFRGAEVTVAVGEGIETEAAAIAGHAIAPCLEVQRHVKIFSRCLELSRANIALDCSGKAYKEH